MRSPLRALALVLSCWACGVATAAADDPYAGFGDPTPVGSVSGPVRAVAPLPGGAAAVLVGAPGMVALDTRAPSRPHHLGPAGDAALATWPDGARLAAWVGPDGAHVARAAGDGTWDAGHAMGEHGSGRAVAAIARPGADAVVAWTEHAATDAPGQDRLFAVVVGADGSPGPVQDLGATTTYVGVPALAVGADGTVALVAPAPNGPGSGPGAPRVWRLAAGAAAFGEAWPLPGFDAQPAAVAVAPDGGIVVTAGPHVARFLPDGRRVSDDALTHAGFWTGVGIAPGGTTAALEATGDGWAWVALAPGGAPLPSGPPVPSVATTGIPEVRVWDDGSAVGLVRTIVGDSDDDLATFVARDPAGAASGTTLGFGPAIAGFPGPAPGSFTAFAVERGRLWRVERPGAPSRRPAWLRLTPGVLRPGERTASFHLAADEAGTATLAVRLRRGGGRPRAVAPAGGRRVVLLPFNGVDARLRLPGRGSPCAGGRPWTVWIVVRFANRSGVPAASRLTYATSCPRVHRRSLE